MRSRWLNLLLTGLAPMVWGSSYIVITEVLPAGYPLFLAAMRALPMGVILCALIRELPRGSWWWKSLVLGMLNIGFFFALAFNAAIRLPGGLAATIGAIQPLIVLGLAWGILGDRPQLQSICFAIVGLVGVGLLVLQPQASLDGWGIISMVGATACIATATVLMKRWGKPASLLSLTAWQLVIGGLFLLPLALMVEGVPPAVTTNETLGFIYMGVINTGIAYVIWFRGILLLPASAMPMLGLLTPVVALALGFFILGQSLSMVQVLGAALVLGSVVFSQWQPKRSRVRPPAQQSI